MKNTINQAFHSPKFVFGFVIFAIMLCLAILVPAFSKADPLAMQAAACYRPGTYFSIADAIEAKKYNLKMDIKSHRFDKTLTQEDKDSMVEWLVKFGNVEESEIPADAEEFVVFWINNYKDIKIKGLTNAKKQYYRKLTAKLSAMLKTSDIVIAGEDPDTGELIEENKIEFNSFTNVNDVTVRKTFLLGTDNFGRDEFIELCHAVGTSLKMGLLAGTIATIIGLILGLLSGYLGGIVDDIIVFITNLFTVIPSFVLIILISFSVDQSARGVLLVGIIIGATSWTWTTRSVRSQVISLRNRDHVNMSKLSGHSLIRIVFEDILPYIASYVVMAFILQISSAILAEAQLSMLGLGPATTKVATLGLMMNWAMSAQTPLAGQWWAFLPVIVSIALVAFSLNLMNTGLDQVFNPQLRD
jgi:ABC-type dipeptide/oligopeptide/nickel transport system permease subunit